VESYFQDEWISLYNGHVLDILREMENESVNCVVTSPPYWSLRDYKIEPQIWDGAEGCEHVWSEHFQSPRGGFNTADNPPNTEGNARQQKDDNSSRVGVKSAFCILCGAWLGQLGLEPMPELFVEHIVAVFRKIKRVLRKDGTCWVNIGDSYTGSGKAQGQKQEHTNFGRTLAKRPNDVTSCTLVPKGLKAKDLCGMPFRVAFALQADGWYLRSDIIWAKPNPMPESITDRPTRSHEYIFLLTKSARYFYDADAVAEDCICSDSRKIQSGLERSRLFGYSTKENELRTDQRKPDGWQTGSGSHNTIEFSKRKREGKNSRFNFDLDPQHSSEHKIRKQDNTENGSNGTGFQTHSGNSLNRSNGKRNLRTVWNIATAPYKESHFATFPPALVERCIKAGCPEDGIVFDPFAGSGTTLKVAQDLGRRSIGIELSKEYMKLIMKRCAQKALL